MDKIKTALTGFLIGLLNGLFGAGGGIVAVKALQKEGLSAPSSHATAVAVMAMLSAVSAFFYLQSGTVSFPDLLPFLPGGIAGALLGGWILPKIPDRWLRRIFSLFILYASFRLFFR
ncbi:MAG: sulfite exporter TauE/SafE family protein [Oscillospiraceae bacterium]|nr:sulfite exporter TauE/SafE family protein [Oscillospiraceae bacterium]MBQ2791669.1 sulfite exporter TauE/SafE family protein [Oscillospiraceae bacterium]MBQ7083419.1 sulfite exporter TauE/SafE family protein [Oscillospiraceae bacterium]MBR2636709.1 sulfite exporter TauE/SafE family protein [Oscillospiraceae bacterium]